MSGWQVALAVFVSIAAVVILMQASPRAGGLLLLVVVFVMLSRGLRSGAIRPVSVG